MSDTTVFYTDDLGNLRLRVKSMVEGERYGTHFNDITAVLRDGVIDLDIDCDDYRRVEIQVEL